MRECDRRLGQYCTALDHSDGEVATITEWIAEVERARQALAAQLGRVAPGGKLTTRRFERSSRRCDIVSVPAECDDDDRAELCQQLCVELTDHPRWTGRRVGASAWGTSAYRRGT